MAFTAPNPSQPQSAPRPIAGVLPVFQTPFNTDGGIDFGCLEAEFDWLFDNGADGVVFAMVSEILRLSSEERDAVAAATGKFVAGRGHVIIGVGAESTEVAVRYARHAQRNGADAVMATPPALFPAHPEQLMRYFTAIAEAVDIPLIVQDASGYVGSAVDLVLQIRLHQQLGDRVMFKPEAPPIGPRLTTLLHGTGGAARVFEGTGGLHLIESYRRGAIGTMPAADLVWALSALWKALTAENYDRAYAIAGPLALIVALQYNLDSYIAIEKHLLVAQGVFLSTAMRGPGDDVLDAQTEAEVERLTEKLREAVDGG